MFDSFTPRQLYQEVTDLVVCCVTLVWIPEDIPLRTETSKNVKCGIVI